MDDNLRHLLERQLSRGELILFTGAGFSAEAGSRGGGKLPVGRELRQTLWPFAFPDLDFDAEASLGDIYEVARRRAQNRVGEQLSHSLSVDPAAVPDFYRLWFAAPWRAMYTLNIDDLDDVANSHFALPTPIRSLSAITDETIPAGSFLSSVHLNGKVSEFPQVTFSAQQYGERTATPDPWYRQLVGQLAAFPVVFVGTALEEPPLWQQIASRQRRTRRSPEVRPRSYLVTPNLSDTRQAILRELNVEWIPMTAEQFASEVLSGMTIEAETGHRALAEVRGIRPPRAALRPVVDLVAQLRTDLADFLLGREPTWADVISGYAIVREFESGLPERVQAGTESVVLITGTAGAGKSTTLLRLATALQSDGLNVQWLDTATDLPLGRIRELVASSCPDVLVIDDVDSFGPSAGPFLSELVNGTPGLRVLGAVRSSRADRLDIARHIGEERVSLVSVPLLEDSDIDSLIDALTKANRLGILRGKSQPEQRAAFRQRAQRQLLVAMIEATLDIRFEEKVHSECRDLSEPEKLTYAILALATSFRQFIRRDELLIALTGARDEGLAALDNLSRKHLVLVGDTGELVLRHRVIAEHVLNFFHESGHFAAAVEGLLYAMAAKLGPGHPTRSREHRVLVRLLNHKFMIEQVRDIGRAREIYDELEDILAWDYHYWLQRGSLEVEVSNVRGAENFLAQAKGLAPDDYRVQTEWAYMLLKRAAQEAEAGSLQSRDLADEAFTELYDAIARRGRTDSYPYHVLGSQGLGWSRRAVMTARERTEVLRKLLDTVREGRRHHPNQRDLELLERDLYREYLQSAND